MNIHTEKHLSRDILDEEVDYLHKELINKNVKVGEVTLKTSNNSYTSFESGYATTYPVFGEVIAERTPTQEHTSFSVFNIADNSKSKEEVIAKAIENFVPDPALTQEQILKQIDIVKNKTAFAWDYREYLAKRKALVIGSVNPTSDGFALFGEIQNGITPVRYDSIEYKNLNRGLSVFEAIKLSREKVIVSERNGKLVAILDARSIPDDITGFLEFDLHKYTGMTSEKITSIKFNLSFKNDDGIVYSALNESYMVDKIIEDIYSSSIISVDICSNKIPVKIDSEIILKNDVIISNNTAAAIMLESDNGEKKYLPPFGIVKGNGFNRAFVLNEYTVFLGENNHNTDGRSLFGAKTLSFNNGKFLDAFKIDERFEISGSTVESFRYTEGGEHKSILGTIVIGIQDVSEESYDTGINNINRIGNYIGFKLTSGQGTMYVYEDEQNKFAKFDTDTDFTTLDFVYQTVEIEGEFYTGFIARFGGVFFIRLADTELGQVFRNKRFIYDVDYDVDNGFLSSEPLYGFAYPIDFFRVKRVIPACNEDDSFPFSQYDNINNARNKYNVGEVSRIMSDELGQISVINTVNNSDDIIDTRYKSVFSMSFDQPVVISSFWTDFYKEGVRKTHSEENWLSVMERDNDYESSCISYAGTNIKANPEYSMVAMSFIDLSSNSEILVVEREYKVDRQEHTAATYWMKQRSSCDKQLEYAYLKLGRSEHPNSYFMTIYDLSFHSIKNRGTRFEFINNKNSYNAASEGDGIYRDLVPSINSYSFGNKNIGMFFINNQIASVMKDRTLLHGDAFKKSILYKNNEMFIYSIPKTGFVMVSANDMEWFSGSAEESQIKDINKRGVSITEGDLLFSAYFEYDPTAKKLFSRYEIETSDSKGNVSLVFEDQMPEWFEGNLYEVDKNDMYPRKFNTGDRENDVLSLSLLKSIPMILANYLYTMYGFTQCVAACWDESISGVLVSEQLDISTDERIVGSELIVTMETVSPSFVHDIVPIVNIFNGNTPYLISSDIIVEVKDHAIIDSVDWIPSYRETIQGFEDDGDKYRADETIMKMLAENFSNDPGYASVTIAPLHYTQQNPWKNAKDYSTEVDKLMLSDVLKYVVYPFTRINLDVSIGIRNTMTASHEFSLFDENYIAIDGVVSEELLTSNPRTDHLDCENTYHLKYRNFYSGLFFLNRMVSVDMSKYPNRRSYMRNNLLRELASPIREDAHSKKMEGRSVVVEWDTRYINENIHTYSEIVYELPTALTCDNLPEEALLSRDHENRSGFYLSAGRVINGEDCVSNEGKTNISFSNDSPSPIIVSLSFKNTNYIYQGNTSYFIDNPLFHYKLKKLWPTIGYNGKMNRIKTGVVLSGTTI